MSRIKATTTRTITRYTCDTCEAEAEGSVCSWCKKDICRECLRRDLTDGGSDYPTKFCPKCYAYAKPFLLRKQQLLFRFDEAMDRLEAKAKSLATIFP